jgi:hypothetical protein
MKLTPETCIPTLEFCSLKHSQVKKKAIVVFKKLCGFTGKSYIKTGASQTDWQFQC